MTAERCQRELFKVLILYIYFFLISKEKIEGYLLFYKDLYTFHFAGFSAAQRK